MKMFLLQSCFLSLAPVLSAEAAAKDLTMEDLVRQVSAVLGVEAMVSGVGRIEQEAAAAESHSLGATELEIEGMVDAEGQPRSRQLVLSQPVRIDFSSGAVGKALGHDSAAHLAEIMQEVAEAAAAVARRMIGLQAAEAELKLLQDKQVFLGQVVKEVNAGRVAQDRIFTSLLNQKLSALNSEIKILTDFVTSDRRELQRLGIEPEQRLLISTMKFEADAAEKSFAVRQLHAQAAAAGERAVYARRHVQFEVAVGAQFEAEEKDPSYLLRLSTPLGQVHTNRHENSRLLREKALFEDRAKLRITRLQQELSAGSHRLERERLALVTIEKSRAELESTFQVAQDGYRRGLVPVDRLHDLHDQVTEARLKEIEARKHLDEQVTDLFFLAGGWQ